MKKIKIILILILFSFIFFPAAHATSPTLKDAFKTGGVLENVGEKAGYSIYTDPLSFVSLVINTALSLLGVVFLVLIVYGGYLWMTDRGNEEQVKRAKNLLTAAVIGLVIVLAAYAISYFVIEKIGSATLNPV